MLGVRGHTGATLAKILQISNKIWQFFLLSALAGPQSDWDLVAPLKAADNFPPKTTESGPASLPRLRFYLKLPIIKGRWLGCHFSLPDATFNDILGILLFCFFLLHF